MKKILIGLLSILLLTGCEKLSNEEAEIAVLDSLENAYLASYIADGVGLAVFADQKIEEEDVTWYKVADNYNSVEELKAIVDKGYRGDVANDLKETIDSKYKVIDGALYSTGVGGCALPYEVETVRDELSKDVTINEIKTSKITITLSKTEYTLTKKSDNWLSEVQIFKCNY